MKVNFLVIGGQRCATTWIFRCLEEHPEVCNISRKGVDFFSYYFHRGFEWYERSFRDCSGFKVIGETSTSYLYDINAPERAYKYNPKMKIIVCLRNPIDRAISQHFWHIHLGHATGQNLALENAIKSNPMYIEQGLYYKYLRRWIEYFPINEKLLVLLYEDLLNNSILFVQSIFDFLEVDSSFIPQSSNRIINKAIIKKKFKFQKISNRALRACRRSGIRNFMDFIKFMGVKSAIRHFDFEKIKNIFEVNKKTRKKLYNFFDSDINKLSYLIEKDLASWRENNNF